MDKLHGKKQVASKKKKQNSENKIRTVKKMKGGGPYFLNGLDLNDYKEFIRNQFINNTQIKNKILHAINSYHSESQKRLIYNNSNNSNNNNNNNSNNNNNNPIYEYEYYIFYIYNKTDNEIISIGIVGKNDFTNNGTTKINGKEYFFINYLLSRKKGNRGGTSAIYHILKCLPPEKYAGICLVSTESAESFYKYLGFTKYKYLFTLDKTPEIISRLEEKLPHPITTEFYSTYPDNKII